MDEIKDIQTRNFSKFLDTEVRTDPFGENRSGDRAYRRAERLSAAIFLLTSHIDPAEDLRRQARSAALSLLDHVLGLRDEMRTGNSAQVREFQAVIRQLISQIRMLVFGGFVSSQNAEAVCGALDELGNFIAASQRSHLSESVRFSKEDLLDVREFYKGHVRDIKDKRTITDNSRITDTSSPAVPQAGAAAVSSRSMSVLEILRAGGEMSIRDILSHLPEYSEKTIQRELTALINRGLARRIGLKRWSKYAIA